MNTIAAKAVLSNETRNWWITNYREVTDTTPFVQRSNIRVGDVIISSHYGKVAVHQAYTVGGGAGTTQFVFSETDAKYYRGERYDGDSFVPVVEFAEHA
jgi:hypothetical protein